jgi:hypothetical protein
VITKRGNALASELNPYLGTTEQIRETCSLIARHARTHARLQEAQCDRELTSREVKREQQIETRLRDLVASLPATDHGPIVLRLSGDPRGYTVKLHVPGVPQHGNTWGLGGDFGV